MLSVSSRAFEANNKGERLVAEAKLEEALAAFSEAVLASPGYVAGWLNRAHVLERLGRNSEAEADRQAARSLVSAMESRSLETSSSQWTGPAAPRTRYGYDSEDVAGPGRYILNFFLAGFVGLLITFLLRNHGWLSTWISIAIFGVMLIILIAEGPEALGLSFESSTR